MIDTNKLLGYIVGSKSTVATIAKQIGLSEIGFIKRIGNMADFTVAEINLLCDVLSIPKEDAISVFFT